ncbi:MAG TPA: hypothetical protein EYP39_07490 [Ghiorsea sp.]|nr:hypothetical protein [Ghiorsea sp.]
MMLAATGVLFVNNASAVEWTIHGALKNETAYFVSGDQRLDKVQNRIDLKPEAILSDRWEFRSRFLGWYDAATDIEAVNTTDYTTAIQDEYRTYSAVKEAYLMYAGDAFDLRLGQQQIVWGKTDGLRLLDVVNPLDMREFLMDDFLDSRQGLIAARLNYYADMGGREHEFEFVFIPDAKPAKFAPRGSRWAYAMSTPPAGVSLNVDVGNEPSFGLKDAEAGIAWRANLDGWDVSLNWFNGWKDTPAIAQNFSLGALTLTPVYQRMNTVGGSASNAFGAFVLRAELAVNTNEIITTSITPTGATTWNAALGLDYNANNWRISPQIFVRQIQNWDNTMVEKENSGFVTLMVSTDYMNDKLKPEIIALMNYSDGSFMLRPKVSYEFSDAVIGRIGSDMFAGDATDFFGQFDDNDRIYTEVEYTF